MKEHGRYGYSLGCRCEICRSTASDYARARRAGRAANRQEERRRATLNDRERRVGAILKRVPEVELSFAAGLMEGEGTVRINHPTGRNQGALLASCVNTDAELIAWLVRRWPGSCKPATGLRPHQRPAFVWVLAAREALAFLEAIEPFVVSERMRERIRTARWWQDIKAKHWTDRTEADYEESFNCYHWMRQLNHRGVLA